MLLESNEFVGGKVACFGSRPNIIWKGDDTLVVEWGAEEYTHNINTNEDIGSLLLYLVIQEIQRIQHFNQYNTNLAYYDC